MFGSSQSFGYAGAAATTQDAPKRARQEDKQTCIPVTVRILQDAVARHAESQEVLIHGTEVGVVNLVGMVESLVKQSAMLEFVINDASGRMKVRHYTTDGSSMQSLAGIAAGCYVNVVGNLRTSPTAHVSAMSLQPVASADEVSYHMIEVAHAALRLRNPSAPSAFHTGIASADPITPAKPGLGLGGSAAVLSPAKAEAPAVSILDSAAPGAMQTPQKVQDLRSAVLDVLGKMGGEEGLDLSALLGQLPSGVASLEKVRTVLTQLVDAGDVFTTIDDDHFAVV